MPKLRVIDYVQASCFTLTVAVLMFGIGCVFFIWLFGMLRWISMAIDEFGGLSGKDAKDFIKALREYRILSVEGEVYHASNGLYEISVTPGENDLSTVLKEFEGKRVKITVETI